MKKFFEVVTVLILPFMFLSAMYWLVTQDVAGAQWCVGLMLALIVSGLLGGQLTFHGARGNQE